MRKRFDQQLEIGQIPISDVKISLKCRDSLVELMAALQAIFINPVYNEKVFSILEGFIMQGKKKTGRTGMDLWQIFVLAQVRSCLNIGYDRLHHIANNDKLVRQLMGIEKVFGHVQKEFEYQNIYDNVTLLDDQVLKKVNAVIIEFGHEVFKKKEAAPLRLKTDSFVVKSNVHFPTDYNLLWDCCRKALDMISKFLKKYPGTDGWRKLPNWYAEIKGLMRELGKASSSGGENKDLRVKNAASRYLNKANALICKLGKELPNLPILDEMDLLLHLSLTHFMKLTQKHIDLVKRRLLKGESIPHDEKMFSIFETYTEMIKKGKLYPNVELGKKLAITTDQFDLIVDYHIMEKESDKGVVISLADRMLILFNNIQSWSFDKGFWSKDNKQVLELEIPEIIMPKLGKRNMKEEKIEQSTRFKRLKNKHSAIESNINELEHRGLDKCPDKGFRNFKRYIGLGVCAYNLKKIGREILKIQRASIKNVNRLISAA